VPFIVQFKFNFSVEILTIDNTSCSFDVLQKNAVFGGAATGALVSAATNKKADKIAVDAITGAAIATAAEFINGWNY
jgi:hypothetical protein